MNTAPKLPADLEPRLRRWSTTLSQTLGDALQAVVLFGGLAKGEFIAGHSDVNVLVALRSADMAVLDRAAPVLQQGTAEFRLAALLLTEADLRDSADVFPIKFLDLQRYHLVLWGEDPFIKVNVTRAQLALRCEQELRQLALRLRQTYVTRAARPEVLQATLERAVSSLLVNLGVLVELHSGQPVPAKQEALDRAAALDLPLAPVRDVWSMKRGELRPDTAALKQLYAGFMAAVEQAATRAGQHK